MALVLLDRVGGEDDPTKLKLLEPVSLGLRQQRNALAAGLSSGVDQLQGLGYSILGGTADLVGANTAKDWANEQARRNQIDASVGGRPDLENIEDQSLGSALPYMGYQIAKQVPIMAGITGAQFIPGVGQAAGALGLTRLGAVAPRVLGGGGLEAGASVAARRAALAQGEALATGTMAGSALGFGSLYGESVEGGDPSPFKALALSPIYGAAEAVLPAVLQGGLRLPSRYAGGLGTRMTKAGAVAGSGEALTELGQNELEMGMRSDLTEEQKFSRRLNSAAAGFLVGGTLGTVGGLKGAPSVPTGINTQQVDLMSGESQVTRPAGSQFKTADQMVGLQTFINQNTGVDRQARKNYEAQFKAAYDEPSGQFVTDPATGIERQLSIGEYQRMQGAALDLTQDNPAAAAAANAAAVKIQRDPKDLVIRDTLGTIPNQYSRQLFDLMSESGVDPLSPLMVSVWNFASQKYMGKGRYEKAITLIDEAIINARKGAPSGTPISTGLGTAGSVGVGGAVVPGTVGTAGSVSPVTGAVGGTTSTTGAPLQQTGVVSGTSGQPSTTVTTPPATTSKFRRAPKPMTVLEAANAAKATQAQQTETQRPQATTPQPVVDERQVVLQQIFGERNGDIIFDVIGMGMAEPEAAAKYGLTRSSIQAIAGATGQKKWPARIAKAKAKLGLSDQQIKDAFTPPEQDVLGTAVEREIFGQTQPSSISEGEAIEGGLENFVNTEGAGTSAVEGFTDLQNEIDATLEALAAETDEAKLEELNAKLAEQIVKVRAVEKRAQAEVRATAGKDTSTQVGETDAVQVESTAVVPVQSETQTGQGVGKQVRRAEKPASKGQTQGQAKEQIDRGKTLWESLSAKTPGLVPYEQLTKLEQDYLTDLAVRTNGKPVVAKEMGLQQLLTKEPVTIDVESRIIDEQVTTQVAALPAPQVERLEQHYGAKRDTAEFLQKVQADITKYVTQGAEAVAGAIRSIIKAMAEGVLAMGIVFNPNITKDAFTLNVAKTFQQTIEITQEVPEAAKAQMSPTAQAVYSAMAPVAMKSGKWFMVADKPNGMLHIFKEDGSHALSDPTLYGKDKGDVLDAVSSLEGGPKITPAGTFTMKESPASYAGGTSLILMESKDYTGYIAVHAADTSTPSENRLGRLASATAEDNRISYGCINTKHDTFINQIKPNISKLDGGMMFILPDAQDQVAQMFAAETRTETRTEGDQGAKTVAAAPVVGKEENMLFGKDRVAKNPYTAERLLTEIRGFIRADIPGRKLIVVDSIEDLLNSSNPIDRKAGEDMKEAGAYGGAEDGRAYLIANRINRGSGRAKFMHEVGAHLGIEQLLSKKQFDALFEQIRKWYIKADGSLEAELAISATERVNAAGTIEKDRRSEVVAYFIENAMEMGIDPTAANEKLVGPLRDWFRTLWAAFKVAVRKLGFKPETLTAQDVVNLAYGAARLEMSGTFHGTAAAFRKFNHMFMGTGEGAQAYGWGTYLAERAGIAKGYWAADVRRKSRNIHQQMLTPYLGYTFASDIINPENRTLEIYEGLELTKTSLPAVARRLEQLGVDTVELTDQNGKVSTVRLAGPEGSLMRTDIGVSQNELMNWDKDLAHSSNVEVRQRILDNISPELLEDLENEANESLAEMRGEDFYRALVFLEKRDGRISDEFKDVADYNKRLANKPDKQIVSAYLDEVLNIPGIKFLDAKSRGDDAAAYTKRLEQEKRNLVELESDEYAHMNPDDTEMTPEQLAAAISFTKASIEQFEKSIAELKATPKTSNLVIFNDKNIFRVAAAASANRQRMQFGTPRFEGLPDRKNPVLDEKVTPGNTNIDKAIRLLNRASKEKDVAAANALRAEAQKLFDSAASRMKFGVNAPAPNQGIIQRNIAKLPKVAQQPVRLSLGAIGDAVNKGLDYVVFTSDLVDRATKSGIGSAKKFVDLVGKSKSEARENELAVEKISDMYALVPEKDRGTGDKSVNRFLFDSTREGKWGYGKYRNDDMGARFDALAPESRAYVEAVFAHGSDMLAKKKKLVLDSTNSEYDAMIAAAKANGDTTNEVKLTKEKEATLKRFQTLFKIRDGIPYAPIKRNGSHVVIAKSKEYLAAEAANDTKKITELESNSDHYHVSFTDGKWEARTLQQDLNDQGFFDDVQIAERDTVIDEMFSGHSALRELTKMRSRVDAQAKVGDKSSSKMLSLISQMYLEALAEGSARKSEMRRRGVAGEVDMIRSFAQQGRADANFMASVKYNPQVQDALQEMRNQVKKGDRERKSEIFNELAKRYVQSLDYSPRPWLNKLTRMSSLYYLATSPAYYLQNLTQPWMMSVPAMAGKHDYIKVSSELFKAYAQLGGVMKSAKLLKQQFDFGQVPSDVRDAIKELVNRGKIDIGLDTEMGEFKVEGDGYFAGKISAADKALRLAVQKVESVNRLSTAMAAYRLELANNKGDKQAAIDYADRILTETHGDYTSFNAPRAFNTGVGKVALQFRKFQLIQLSFYAKLIKDSLSGADRAAALKTLSYSFGHTALLAGAMGLPGYAAISWAIGALFGSDDEPYDLTREIRKAIGDEDIANLVLRGAPTLAGVDISGKVGAGNMLSIMPFSQADLSTTAGRAEAFGTLIGGASLGMASRMIDGLGLMMSGDWYRGIEQTMPKGVSDAMKAYRISNEGMTRRNGDIILPPDEVSAMDALFQAIGVQPVKQTVAYERQTDMKETTQNFTERTTKIKNDYVKAAREGNTEAQGKAREAWTNLQAAKQRNGVKSSPLSELMRAPAEQAKRERMTVGGVQYKANTRQLAEELAGN